MIRAIAVLNIMEAPIPWITRPTISIEVEIDAAHKIDAAVSTIFPSKNMRLRPTISAILPIGTKNTADDSRKLMLTQLIVIASMPKESEILGSAIFTAAPRNGLMKEVRMTSSSRIFRLYEEGSSASIPFDISEN